MTLHHLVIIIFISLILFLLKKRKNNNKFHLDYFLYHLLVLLQLPILYTLRKDFNINFKEFFFFLGAGFHISSYVFIILHVQSCLQGHRVSLKFYHIILPLIFILFCALNYFGLYLFKFSTQQTVFFDIEIKDSLSFTNTLLIKQIISLGLITYLFWFFKKNIKKSKYIKRKKTYATLIYSYVLLFAFSLGVTSSLFFGLFDSRFNGAFFLSFRIITVINTFYFAMFPSVIYYLPIIKKEEIFDTEVFAVNYNKINLFFKNEEIFLNKNLNLRNLSINIGLTENDIRQAIKNTTGLNFKDFINKYRIEYSVELMKAGFLINGIISSLGEKSGFESKQTYYRAFKKFKNSTPASYWKERLK